MSWSVQTTRGSTGNGGTENKIEVRTINDIVHSFGSTYELFVTKIDIEGFEQDLFSENTGWLGLALNLQLRSLSSFMTGNSPDNSQAFPFSAQLPSINLK
jgi:hypothetical protein